MKKKIITRQQAISLGLKKYFTGKPCKYGHVNERRVSTFVCVECSRMYKRNTPPEKRKKQSRDEYLRNKENKLEYQRRYRAKNKERLKKRDQEYHIKNRDKFNDQGKKWKRSPANFDTYAHQLIGHKCRKTEDGKLETTCKKCNEWFLPTNDAVMSRVKGINGKSNSAGSEHHLYCSDECKAECDLYGVKLIPKSLRAPIKASLWKNYRQRGFNGSST
jgi:hypothetical protein